MAEFNGKQGVWRTVGGRRIFIVDGEDLATAMKNSGKFKLKNIANDDTIEKKVEINNENMGIHYGDLGKANDTYYWSINSSNRSTGHFGTGTYFYSKEEDNRNQNYSYFSRKNRPRHIVDFSEYELYRPANEIKAMELHEGLKAINYGKYDDLNFKFMQTSFKIAGVSEEKINNAIKVTKLAKEDYIKKGYDDDFMGTHDSMSTIFMKELGFNGIDVRNIEGFDNSVYGSVIYDLNKKKKK